MPIYDQNVVDGFISQINAYNTKAAQSTLTQAEANAAHTVIQNYYGYLDSVGISYGQAALDVANNEGFFGLFANELLVEQLEIANPSYTSGQISLARDSIMIKLAFQDMNVRSTPGVIDGNISYDAIAGYHYTIFGNSSLPKTAWGGAFFEEFGGGPGSYMDFAGYDNTTNFSFWNAAQAIFSNAVSSEGFTAVEAGEMLFFALDDVVIQMNANAETQLTEAEMQRYEILREMFSDLREEPNPNTLDNSLFNLEVDVDTSNLIEGTAWEDGIVDFGADWVITMDPLVLNVDGLQNVYASSIVSDAYRPGAASLSTFNLPSLVDNVFNSWQNDLYTPGLTNLEFNFVPATLLNNFYYASPTWLNIDPLVLDMDGDGIELTTFEQANVVFDIDNDGLDERTGWLNGDDAFLVRDNNNDGIINDVSEIFSEYFDGGAANDNEYQIIVKKYA